MIPPFGDDGNLPPGVHPATLEEVDARFGQSSEVRRAQMESLRWLVELVRQAGVTRLVINGSFVTSTIEPNDVDCALLLGEEFPRTPEAEEALEAGLPYLDIQLVPPPDFLALIGKFFATNREMQPKGMIEVIL